MRCGRDRGLWGARARGGGGSVRFELISGGFPATYDVLGKDGIQHTTHTERHFTGCLGLWREREPLPPNRHSLASALALGLLPPLGYCPPPLPPPPRAPHPPVPHRPSGDVRGAGGGRSRRGPGATTQRGRAAPRQSRSNKQLINPDFCV
jgi:hypothetical protein